MKSNIAKFACLLMMVLSVGATTSAQENSSPQSECSRSDKSKPPLFITFERAETREVLLRLHNNSRCPVLIPTNQLNSSVSVVKQPNGNLRIERTEELKDGSRVPVVYNLFNLRGSKDTVIVTEGCVVITRQLLPQQSVVFAISLESFRKNADVGIEFSYLWEEDGGSAIGGEFGHYVFFRNEYLPQGAVR